MSLLSRIKLPLGVLLVAALVAPSVAGADDPRPARPGVPAPPPEGGNPPPPEGGPPPDGGGGGQPGENGAGEPGAAGATGTTPTPTTDRQKPPEVAGAKKVTIDFQNTTLRELALFFADLTGRNFILGEDRDLKETVTIISHKPVSVTEAYEAFLQALEMHGYTTITVGQNTRIVKANEAAQSPITVQTGDEIPYSSNFVTQIFPLENVSVSDVQSVVTSLASPEAKVVAYAPSNTFIITDQAHNIRRIYKIVSQLDIAAPKSKLEIIPIIYADSAEIKTIIEELYGTAATDSGSSSRAAASGTASTRRRPRRDEAAEAAPAASEGVTAGKESKYISKVLDDERTNSLIVLANEEGMGAVKDLVAKLDVDVDPANRSQIHVVYLEHAKAEDVASVLANLSQSGSSSQQQTRGRTQQQQPAGRPGQNPPPGGARGATPAEGEGGGSGSVTAAFDSGMRITHDEATNALVIIAAPDDFAVVKQVIDKLDIRRRQVFIDAVIVELASTDELEKGVAYHQPIQASEEVGGIIGSQLGAQSLGLTQDLLSGLAVGVFGPTVNVPIYDPTGTVTSLDVPAFGIVLQALRTAAAVDIVSNPSITTLDNEEAKIVVGRKVPFPTSTSFSQLGTPIVSYQREDVATTLKVIPRINSSNEVTLEITVEVSEVEEDSSGLDVNQAGFITSKREVEQTALVGDNETFVLGGLVGTTETRVETKVPVLGDLPVVGVLFRGQRDELRRTNLMIFLTPHIIDDDMDMIEIMEIKEAQRQEFIRRFYGKSRDEQMAALDELLKYSMNQPGEPSLYRGSPKPSGGPRSETIGDIPGDDQPQPEPEPEPEIPDEGP